MLIFSDSAMLPSGSPFAILYGKLVLEKDLGAAERGFLVAAPGFALVPSAQSIFSKMEPAPTPDLANVRLVPPLCLLNSRMLSCSYHL